MIDDALNEVVYMMREYMQTRHDTYAEYEVELRKTITVMELMRHLLLMPPTADEAAAKIREAFEAIDGEAVEAALEAVHRFHAERAGFYQMETYLQGFNAGDGWKEMAATQEQLERLHQMKAMYPDDQEWQLYFTAKRGKGEPTAALLVGNLIDSTGELFWDAFVKPEDSSNDHDPPNGNWLQGFVDGALGLEDGRQCAESFIQDLFAETRGLGKLVFDRDGAHPAEPCPRCAPEINADCTRCGGKGVVKRVKPIKPDDKFGI